MLGKWTNKSIWMLLFALMGMILSGGVAQAGTYNATGRWSVNYTVTSLTQGCVSAYPKEWVVTVAQANDTFTLSESSVVLDSGKVTDDAYTLHAQTPSMTRDFAFKLTGENQGTGTLTSTWSAQTSGSCTEQGDIKVSRTMEPVFNITGSWTLQVGADVLDAQSPNVSSCESAPARTLSVNIIQSGTTISMEVGGSTLVTGEVDGGIYTFKHIDSAVKTDWTSYRFLMTNKDAGNGAIQWVRKVGTCFGSNTITMTRSDQQPADPNATLGMAPLNLTVGSTRMLALQHVTGTPTFTASPETGVITLTSSSGVTNVTCDAPGQAVVTVTDANGAATANIVCVARPVTIDSMAIAEWMLPSGVTLVTRNLKKNNQEGSVSVQSFHWSRAGKTATFLDRGSVSLVEGDDGRYYSLNDTGLIIHGEKHWDVGREKLIHKAQYGFVRAPLLTADNMSISQEDVAIANTTAPGPILPTTIADGYADTVTRIAFNLDANTKPIPNQWHVSKQEIVAHLNLNLLDSVLPDALQDDEYFKEWRDAITDTGLLSKLTSVVHIHRSETHWEAGNPTPWVEHADLYLAKGLGVVYEKRHELDGVAKKALVAQTNGTALVSLTNHSITDRKFTINAPVGVTLENPFVMLRVDHTTNLPASDRHIHQVAGSYNEATGSGSPLLTVYVRSNAPVLDPTDVVTLTYGASGYEPQKMADVAMATMTSPMVLTLRPEHLGRAVTFTVKDASGVPIKSGGLLIYPYKNGACVQNLVASHDLSESGTVTAILADGQHCAALMPAKIGDFIGGYYDPSVDFGQINIVEAAAQGAGIPFTVSSSQFDFQLVAGRDDGPDHSLVSGRLTDGTNGLSNADILVYPKQGGAPLLFQTDKDGNFSFDLPAGQYVFGFRHVGNGSISQGFLTGRGEINTLSANREQGVAQTIFANTLMGSVSLTAAFKTSTVTLSGVITDKTAS
ncbi:MAG: carboxypeptidase-like regulatory domain-containing protein [Magnetococcus sp. YQC-5]